ncbi:MAG TPA: hypothetical protein VL866_24350 [Pyrinomonadaceae bacterium]|nr:hypothetical protein [Pyrinomonadaceae bacterium]
MTKTLTEYLYGIMQNGSDGVGGDWSAEEAAKAIEYEAEQYLKSQRTQPAPETGEWSVVANETASDYYHLIQNNQTIGVLLVKPEIAAQIIADHAAVPRLEDALIQARNNAQVFIGAQYLDTARQGLAEIVKQIDAALTTLRREG